MPRRGRHTPIKNQNVSPQYVVELKGGGIQIYEFQLSKPFLGIFGKRPRVNEIIISENAGMGFSFKGPVPKELRRISIRNCNNFLLEHVQSLPQSVSTIKVSDDSRDITLYRAGKRLEIAKYNGDEADLKNLLSQNKDLAEIEIKNSPSFKSLPIIPENLCSFVIEDCPAFDLENLQVFPQGVRNIKINKAGNKLELEEGKILHIEGAGFTREFINGILLSQYADLEKITIKRSYFESFPRIPEKLQELIIEHCPYFRNQDQGKLVSSLKTALISNSGDQYFHLGNNPDGIKESVIINFDITEDSLRNMFSLNPDIKQILWSGPLSFTSFPTEMIPNLAVMSRIEIDSFPFSFILEPIKEQDNAYQLLIKGYKGEWSFFEKILLQLNKLLHEIRIEDSPSFTSLPSIPENLQKLYILRCPNFRFSNEQLPLLESLNEISTDQIVLQVQGLQSLQKVLSIKGLDFSTSFLQSLLINNNDTAMLYIEESNSHIKLPQIPNGLKVLTIKNCPNFEFEHGQSFSSSFEELRISGRLSESGLHSFSSVEFEDSFKELDFSKYDFTDITPASLDLLREAFLKLRIININPPRRYQGLGRVIFIPRNFQFLLLENQDEYQINKRCYCLQRAGKTPRLSQLLNRLLQEEVGLRGDIEQVAVEINPVLKVLEEKPWLLPIIEENTPSDIHKACINQPVRAWQENAAWVMVASKETPQKKFEAVKYIYTVMRIVSFIQNELPDGIKIGSSVEVEFGNVLLREIHEKFFKQKKITEEWIAVPKEVAYEGSVSGMPIGRITAKAVETIGAEISNPDNLIQFLLEGEGSVMWQHFYADRKTVEEQLKICEEKKAILLLAYNDFMSTEVTGSRNIDVASDSTIYRREDYYKQITSRLQIILNQKVKEGLLKKETFEKYEESLRGKIDGFLEMESFKIEQQQTEFIRENTFKAASSPAPSQAAAATEVSRVSSQENIHGRGGSSYC